MITVSLKHLVSAIVEADAFKMPEMNSGTKYLYESVYDKLSKNMDVRLSELDFDAFDLEDIDALNITHDSVFERNYYAAGGIMSTLQATAPICKTVGYV